MLARSSFAIYMTFNRYRTCRARVCAITIIERAMDYTRCSDKPSHERKCYFFFLSSFSHHLLGTLIIIKLIYLIDEVVKIIAISGERCSFMRNLGMEEEGESEEMQQKRNVDI